MKLTLRLATQRDAETILAINLRSISELCSVAYDVATLQQWVGARSADFFRTSIERGQIDLAEAQGETIGFTDAVPGEVLAIYVLPGFERQGVGTFLLAAALQKARDGERPVTVLASLNAVQFYAKHGFRKVSEATHSRNNVDLPLVRMELKEKIAEPGTSGRAQL